MTQRFSITLVPVPDRHGRAPVDRLKAFLKDAIRRHGLRCVHAVESRRPDTATDGNLDSQPHEADFPADAHKDAHHETE